MDLDGRTVCSLLPVPHAVAVVVPRQGKREHAVPGIHRHRFIGLRGRCSLGEGQPDAGLQGTLHGCHRVRRVQSAGAGVQQCVASAAVAPVALLVRVEDPQLSLGDADLLGRDGVFCFNVIFLCDIGRVH